VEPDTISVIIPCHDSSAFVTETVESVLSQTRQDFEIVFIDDGSVDETPKLIERMIDIHPAYRMQLVRQTHGGVASARNRGIAEAKGRFILPLDADDRIAPTMLEECAALLDADPKLSIVYTDREDFGDVERKWIAGAFELERLKYFNQISYCSMFRRSMWSDIPGYRTNVDGFDDWDFWVASALRGFRGMHLPKPLFKHRRHGASYLWRILDRYERLHAQIVLNNRKAYSAAEVEMAAAVISEGRISSIFKSSKLVFMSRYYDGYPSRMVT